MTSSSEVIGPSAPGLQAFRTRMLQTLAAAVAEVDAWLASLRRLDSAMKSRWLPVVAIAACGPAQAEPVGDDSSSTGDDASSSSSAGVCEVPQSDPEQPIMIRVRNDASAIRWFVRASCMFPLQLDGPDGENLTERAWGRCRGCDGVVADACNPWCEDHCDGVTVGIAPGGVFEATWHGRLIETVTLACESCNAACDVATAASPGTYRAAVQVFDQCEAIRSNGCECEPDASGVCEIWSAASLPGDGIELARDFDFPSADQVDLVIAN